MNALNNAEKAAGEAFDRVRKVVGVPTDPNLRMYMRLKPTDFQKLEQKFGFDNVMRYITTMETRMRRK